jgi:hypothetical protein
MTAYQIATLIKLARQAHDRGEIGIKTFTGLVRNLQLQAQEQGILDAVKQVQRQEYEAPANG